MPRAGRLTLVFNFPRRANLHLLISWAGIHLTISSPADIDFVPPEIFVPAHPSMSLRPGLTTAMWTRASRWSDHSKSLQFLETSCSIPADAENVNLNPAPNQKLGGHLQMSNIFHFFGTPSEPGAGRLIDLLSRLAAYPFDASNRYQNSRP